MQKAVRITCFGRVQGVFFRASTQKEALALGVKGWVRNEKDGSVRIVVEGDAQNVDQLIQWAYSGPEGANVIRVDVVEEELLGFSSFEIRRF